MKSKRIILFLGIAGLGGALWFSQPHRQLPATGVTHAYSEHAVPSVAKETAITKQESLIPATPASSPKPLPAKPDLASVPEPIRAIVDLEGNAWSRLKLVRSLPSNLAADHVALFVDFLKAYHAEDEGQEGWVLKNDLMDALCDQDTPSLELTSLLTTLCRETNQNMVIRDYALQHLGTFAERLNEPLDWPAGEAKNQQETIKQLLWGMASDTQSAMAGTALLGLTRLASTGAGVDTKLVGTQALKLAADSEANPASRVTALQVCARLRVTEALPLITQAAEKEPNLGLRISAIAAAGQMGGNHELEMLRRVIQENNPGLQPALGAALAQIERRVGSNATGKF